ELLTQYQGTTKSTVVTAASKRDFHEMVFRCCHNKTATIGKRKKPTSVFTNNAPARTTPARSGNCLSLSFQIKIVAIEKNTNGISRLPDRARKKNQREVASIAAAETPTRVFFSLLARRKRQTTAPTPAKAEG